MARGMSLIALCGGPENLPAPSTGPTSKRASSAPHRPYWALRVSTSLSRLRIPSPQKSCKSSRPLPAVPFERRSACLASQKAWVLYIYMYTYI